MTPFLFFTFCSHLMTPIFKMISYLMTPFFEIFISENGRHALTEWRPFLPINDHLVICTQYLFGRRDFALRLRASQNDPIFFFKLKSSLKDPLFFYSPHQTTPYFSFVLTERPHFSLFSLSPKDQYFWGRVRTSPSLPYMSAPLPTFSLSTPRGTTWCHFNWERVLNFDPMKIRGQSINYGGTPLNNPPIEIRTNSSMFVLIFWPHVTIFCIFWLHEY